MLITDSVLAAVIAGTATLSASFLQLRSALLREGASRSAAAAARRKNRMQLLILLVVIGAAAVGGFAASQWLTNGERASQAVMQRELQARVAEISRTTSQLELTRSSERAEIERGVLRQIGLDGVVVMAGVPACRPALSAAPATSAPTADAAPAPAHACTEAEASPVTLCATIPDNATVTEVELFSRPADSDAPWSTSRLLPGQEAGQARFAEKYSESTPDAGARQVCQAFVHWSAERARIVRMIVRYSLPV
jgi:hypothetical protein